MTSLLGRRRRRRRDRNGNRNRKRKVKEKIGGRIREIERDRSLERKGREGENRGEIKEGEKRDY